MLVVSAHLCVEHLLLRGLAAVLPKAEFLERERSPGFPLLVSLCEAHAVISPEIGDVLRTLNSIRNRCAHQGNYNPDEPEWKKLESGLRAVATVHPEIDPSLFGTDKDTDQLDTVVTVVELRARAVGATDLEVG